MKTHQLLREYIQSLIEGRPWDAFRAWPGEKTAEWEEYLGKKDTRIKRGGGMQHTQAAGDNAFEEEVLELMEEPEFQSIDAFAEFKIDNEEDSFSTVELQALARNLDFKERGIEGALPPQPIINHVKSELQDGYGLMFKARQPPKHFRGAMSSAHGTSPFAGTGGGGSGFSSGGLGLGTGPGVIGGKTKWDAKDNRNLPMGSRRK